MNGNRSCAWVVVVANDDLVESAILTGETLKKTESCSPILALISNSISKPYISLLESVYALVIVKDVETLTTKLNHADSEVDALLLSALNMTTFSKLVVIRPGIMVLRQSDKLFDTDNLVILDKAKSWGAMIITPDNRRYKKIVEKLEKNDFLWSTSSISTDLMNLIFSPGKWKSFSDEWIVYGGKDGQQHEDVIAKKLSEPFVQPDNDEDTSDWISIVGMACRFPDANSPQEYWDLLASGRNACSSPPDHRTKLVDLDPAIKANFLKCPIDQFDAGFFGLSPSEATFTDPQARLVLEASWEAFEDAAINPDKLKGTQTGVFYGSWLQEYRDAINTDGTPASEDFIRKYLGNSFGCSAAKLSFFYGLTGPNVSTESGCSSSMVAVDLAVKSLQKRECPIAMVAGANILLHMNVKQKVLWAEDGKSKTFDADANGYARAEGIAVLILKRFSDAKRDGDRVHAVIRGSAFSQEGLSKSFGTPTVDSECAAMRGALRNARVEPAEVDYVEAHATGTAVGDPIEAHAIVKAYSPENGKSREKPLYIGSGKTNVGHTESCSGLAGIFKVVLAMKNQTIPAHLNLTKINPQVNFDSIPGTIPVEAKPWPRENGKPRIAGVSSFGITGTDVHVILQEAPDEQINSSEKTENVAKSQTLLPPLHLLTFSAKSEGAMEESTKLYLDYLETSAEKDEDITYTASTCRPHHPFRVAVLGRNKQELSANLAEGSVLQGKAINSPKICFTFPGRIGLMDLEPARILYKTAPVFKTTMDYCNKLFQKNTGKTLIPLLTNAEEDTLSKGVTWYALIPALQYSLVKLWASWGVYPDCVMGHCIGEISAAVVSGALPLESIFKLVQCMEYFLHDGREQPALMMAIQATVEKVQELISSFLENNNNNNNQNDKDKSSSWIEVASCNAFDQIVVAGDTESIKKFKTLLNTLELKSKLLTMDFCAHSRAVEPACQKSLEIFEGIIHYKMKIPYVSSVTGQVVRDEEMGGQYWYNVFRQCVNFTNACHTTSSNELADVYIEMGLEGALSRLTQENLAAMETPKAAVCLPSLWKVRGDKCWVGLLCSLGQLYTLGGSVDWESYYGNQEGTGELLFKRVKLPPYPFQRKSFWYERRRKEDESSYNQQQLAASHVSGKRIHSLLGSGVETCVDDVHVFQNWISETSTTRYIYDHLIGTQVIYPGAAFLEMILAAVNHATGTNDELLHVEEFTVSSPLHLEESLPRRIQCVVDNKRQSGRVYSLHGEDSDATEKRKLAWKVHAVGDYKVGSEEGDELNERLDNFEEFSARLTENSTSGIDEFYLAAQQVGLNFGKSFRSLKEVVLGEGGKEVLIKVGLPPEEEERVEEYICHPILIDAMIQGLMLYTKPELKKLHVPVRIGKFSVRKELFHGNSCSSSSTWYVYCKTEPESNVTKLVYLLNQDGVIIASMANAELVMTSVDSVLKAAGYREKTQQRNSQETEEAGGKVSLFQFDVVFKPSVFHQTAASIQMKFPEEEETKRLLGNAQYILDKKNVFSAEESKLDKSMNRLCYLYVVKTFHEYGWVASKGIDNLLSGNLTEKWGVVPGLVPAFKHFASFIDNEALMESTDNYGEIIGEINKILADLKDYGALKTVQACGSHMGGILRGSVNPHMLLFGGSGGGDSSCNLAEHFYKTTRFANVAVSVTKTFKAIFEQVNRSRDMGGTETVRILEVGAGTGRFATEVLKYFKTSNFCKFEYTFSDVSPSFLVRGKQTFEGEPYIFKTFNIEGDPLKQGLCPDYFDVVVAIDVVHATRNVKESLRNLQVVTKPGGWILLAETEKPVREVDICFGVLEGYWLFEDGIRKEHCTLNGDKWLELLRNNGFTRGQGKFLSCNNQMSVIIAQKEEEKLCIEDIKESKCYGNWMLFLDDYNEDHVVAMEALKRKMKAVDRNVTVYSLSQMKNMEKDIKRCFENNQSDNMLEGIIIWMAASHDLSTPPESRKILEPLLYLGKYLLHRKWKVLPRLHMVTERCQGTVVEMDSGCQGYGNPNVAQAMGFLRNLRIELPGILSKSIDLELRVDVNRQISNLMTEMWLDDKETEVAFRGNVRYLRRALQKDVVQEDADVGIHGNGRYFNVELPKSKVIRDVKFVAMDATPELAADKILVEVKSVSLNFKDVLAVMKPSSDFEHLTSIGLDFSGVIAATGDQVTKWKVGQSVFGCGWEQGAMKSHVVSTEEAIVAVPDWMTFNEAATLPAVWITAWYCMVDIAKLQKGQTLLVHAASGGVGLIAIQIAKLLGVRVIGTAGTEKKRNFVRNLGVKHVFNSRNTDFGQCIQEISQGNGVDMVLNCLTGPGFKEASLQVCKDGGNFVEISKLDIWTPAQVQEKRPDVKYTIVDATQINKATLQDIMNKLSNFLANGTIKPLPYTQYSAFEIRESLTFLQKAKQIGKVIVTMPKYTEEQGGEHRRDNLFNDKSSYLITGGKGAIGMAVAKWMVTQGAKYLVLVGRSSATEEVQQAIHEMEQNYGAKVICKEIDITNLEQCRHLVEEFSGHHRGGMPPLRGIHHCAGLLHDKLLSQQENWSSYEAVIHPKVQGAWNLHQLTMHLPMEFFVLYSSAAGTFGNIGQSNYVAANSYLDALAEMRVAMGLACLSINWGQWNLGFAKDISINWLHPFTADEGTATLENLMRRNNRPTVVTGLFDYYGLLSMTPYFGDTFLSTLCLDQASFFGRSVKTSEILSKKQKSAANKVLLVDLYQRTEDKGERHKLVKDFVIRILCETLGTKPEEIQDEDQHFSEMGMDSLMSIEFANKINSEMEGGSGGGGFIDLEECGTVTKMTELIDDTLTKLMH